MIRNAPNQCVRGLGGLALLLAVVSGCAPEPMRIRLQREVQFAELAGEANQPSPNSYKLITDSTSDLFPGKVAIARLAVPMTGEVPLVVEGVAQPDQGYWTETFRGNQAVQGLIFLDPAILQPAESWRAELCHEARREGATLLIAYVSNRFGGNQSRAMAIVLDVQSCMTLAVASGQRMFIDAEGQQLPPEPIEGDQRWMDARYQADREVQRQLRGCMLELVLRDRESKASAPPPETPFPERWWVPQQIRVR